MSKPPSTPIRNYPEVGELVVATVANITDYGAYVTLDEYEGLEGLIHVSEVSSSWVKNIRDYLREREKVVLKVLRVDVEKKHIDLSLRRVSGMERQQKMLEWKKKRRAEYILGFAAQKLGLEPKTFIGQVMPIIEEKFDTVYSGLEELVERGEDLLERLKIPKEWAQAIVEVSQQKIKLPTVKIKGTLQLTCYRPDGIDVIKKILIGCKAFKKPKKVKIDVYTVGAPSYLIEVSAKNYKDAERALQEAANFALQEIKSVGGEGSFKR